MKPKYIALVLIALLAGALGGVGSTFLIKGDSSSQPVPRENVSITEINVNSTQEGVVKGAYQEISPSVVHITSTVLTRNFFGVVPQQGSGSGVVVSKEGHIITNNHVIQGASSIKVIFKGGEEYSGRVVGTKPEMDIAVIEVDAPPEKLKPANFGSSERLEVGSFVLAVGNPFGLKKTATLGIVSALNRTISTGEGSTLRHMIQTDASINPGNSGGPLINLEGEVVGINTAILSPSGGNIGIGFAIPIEDARATMKEILKKGEEKQGENAWLGIRGYTLSEELARKLNLEVEEGAVVAQVVPGSPADQAGLKGGNIQALIDGRVFLIGGDVILEIDGERIGSMEEVVEIISSHQPGDEIEITYLREGAQRTLEVTLGRRVS